MIQYDQNDTIRLHFSEATGLGRLPGATEVVEGRCFFRSSRSLNSAF